MLLQGEGDDYLTLVMRGVDDPTQAMGIAMTVEMAVIMKNALEAFLSRARRDLN